MQSNPLHKPAFTLIELLLVIGIIGILSSIVIVAVDPVKQLNDAFGASGQSQANQLSKAIQQYLIDNGEFPSALTSAPQTICSPSQTGATCVSLDADLTPTYIAEIPQVGSYQAPDSGLEAYIDGSFIQVTAKNVAANRAVQPNRAYLLDGTNDSIIAPGTYTADTGTITFWASPQRQDTSIQSIWANHTAAYTGIGIHFYNGVLRFMASSYNTTTVTAPLNTWNHFAIVFKDGDTLLVYKNGVLEQTIAQTYNSPANQVEAVGRLYTGSASFSPNVKLFDFRRYSGEKSASEITNIYNGAVDVTNLLYWYKADDVGPVTAYDSSGNGNHGTKTNTTSATFNYEGNDVPYSFQNRVGYTLYDLGFEGNDVEILTGAEAALLTSVDISFKLRGSDPNNFVLFTKSTSGGPYVFLSVPGGTSTGIYSGIGSITWTLDSVVQPAGTVTRGDLFTVLMDDVEHTITMSNVNLSGFAATGMYFGGYSTGVWQNANFSIYDLVIDGVEYGLQDFLPRNEALPTQDVLGNELQYSGSVE